DDVEYTLARIERRVRILEDHLDVISDIHFLTGCVQLPAVEQYVSCGDVVQSHDRLSGRGLARTGLAYEAVRRSFRDIDAHPVDRFDMIFYRIEESSFDRIMHFKVLYLKQCHQALPPLTVSLAASTEAAASPSLFRWKFL